MNAHVYDRRKILDGTLPAFFGPGQTPQVADPDGSYNDALLIVYYPWTPPDGGGPPDDWPAAGTLAVPPQVVFLHLQMPGLGTYDQDFSNYYDGRYYSPLATDRTDPTAVAANQYAFDEPAGQADTFVSGYFRNGIVAISGNVHVRSGGTFVDCFGLCRGDGATRYGTVDSETGEIVFVSDTISGTSAPRILGYEVPNPFPAEYRRVLAACRQAKAMVEQARPGKTYVVIVDESLIATRVVFNIGQPTPPQTVHVGTLGFHYTRPNYCIAPSPDQPGFRTNFLHVVIGTASANNLPQGGFLEGIYAGTAPQYDSPDFASPDDAANRAALVAAAGAFPRFGLRFISTGVDPVSFPVPAETADDFPLMDLPTVYFPTDNGPYYIPWNRIGCVGFQGVDYSVVGGDTIANYPHNMQIFIDAAVKDAQDANAHYAKVVRGGDNETYMKQAADDLASRGMDAAYLGDTGIIDDEGGYLAGLIADYYGFSLP